MDRCDLAVTDPVPIGDGRRPHSWDALHPYSLGGAYTNFMMDEGADRVQASYGSNYKRLAKIKARYDPANLFHVNQNIQPKS